MPTYTGPGPLGPGVPVPSATEPGVWEWDRFMRDPLEVLNVINAVPAGYFIGEQLLGTMPAPTGIVLYNQLTSLDLYIDQTADMQPGVVAPGSEYPIVTFNEAAERVLTTKNRGGKFFIYDHEIRADRRDLAGQRIIRYTNSIRKIHNDLVIQAILNDPTVVTECTIAASGAWSDVTTKAVSDIRSAARDLDGDSDLGYSSEWGMIHPDAADAAFDTNQVQNFLPRENRELNPLFNKGMVGFGGIEKWIVHKGVPRGKVVIGSGKDVGFIAQCRAPFTKTEREEELERQKYWGGREEAVVINQPMAVRVISGVLA